MPLVAIACLSYAVGLFIAQAIPLSSVPYIGALFLAAGILGLMCAAWRWRGLAICSLVTAAAMGIGSASLDSTERCARK